MLATPESRDRSNRSHTSDPNYGIDDSPCSKKYIQNIDSKENHGASAVLDRVLRLKGRVTEIARNRDASVAMRLGE